ncbi:MAG: hypothetical protein AAFQ94_06170 [Bacteroidota bacterium]
MNRVILIFVFSLAIFTLSACLPDNEKENLSLETDFDEISVADLYALKVPKYMKRTTSLNSEASFQCNNVLRTAYCIVIDESKDEFISSFRLLDQYAEDKSILDNYADAQIGFLTEDLTVTSLSETEKATINGLETRIVTMDASSNDIPHEITYFITFYEGSEHIYMMMNWTLSTKKTKLSDTFDKIASSFKSNR